jgi:hypothetical protein
LEALGRLDKAWEKLRPKFPWLRRPQIEVGLEKIPYDELTPEHIAELTSRD